VIGTKLAHYEITSHLGTGGMGEVYQATDSKLGRSVAIKFLPEAFSHESERVARFQREARVLASLNHVNIAAIHGVDEINGRHFLVMEFVPGETLAERIKKGPIPIEEALPIAKQIADALEEAHEKGIIHRDLKPANIKVKEDGTVKVLDFGLATALSDEVAESDMSNSPTLSMAATRQGVILGTAAYMSPEQAKGKRVDRRTDVWAFGCVLYEMLTGKAAFQGEDVTEILAAIVMKEPAFDALPAKTSSAIRMLLRRCLEKNLRRRLGHMSEARIILEDVLSGVMPPEAEVAPATARKSRERLLAGAVVITAIIAALGWGAFAYFRSAPQQPETMRFFVSPPDGWNVTRFPPGGAGAAADSLAISPDGRQVAFLATKADGITRLWVRSLDTLTAQALGGTEGALRPFWSPDSKALAGSIAETCVSSAPCASCAIERQGARVSLIETRVNSS
jgi:eukaryotic-like serine/threonine-protein kinase